MHAQVLFSLLRQQPFEPFRLSLSDGREFVVRHPELAFVDRRTLYLGIGGSNPLDEPAERTMHIDLTHIVSTQPLERGGRKRKNGNGEGRK